MELRHLEYFVAVAEERSFTRAAARLHVVQSGVSAVIKSLERDLGAALLDRTSKRVALTDAGEALLPRARAALDAARAARDAVDEVRGGLRGTLRFGTLTSIAADRLPALLGRFHRTHPGSRCSSPSRRSGSAGLVDALADGRWTSRSSRCPGRPPAGVQVRQLLWRRLDLVVPAGHRLAAAEEVADSPTWPTSRSWTSRPATATASWSTGRSRRRACERQVAIEMIDISTGRGLRPARARHRDPAAFRRTGSSGFDREASRRTPTWTGRSGSPSPRCARPSAAARALLALIAETAA